MFETCVAPLFALLLSASAPPATLERPAAEPPRHCQVPCGIYGDMMRIDMFLEDVATIEKGMNEIPGLVKKSDFNQVVRWITTKDQHAQAIQDRVADYWLAQRIKAPAPGEDNEKYVKQLQLLHGITVAAMKCKQTTDVQWPQKIKALVHELSQTYFTKEDLEHLKKHHQGHDHK